MGVRGDLSAIGHIQLPHKARDIRLDGALAYAQVGSDRLVRLAPLQSRYYLGFTPRERSGGRAISRSCRFVAAI